MKNPTLPEGNVGSESLYDRNDYLLALIAACAAARRAIGTRNGEHDT